MLKVYCSFYNSTSKQKFIGIFNKSKDDSWSIKSIGTNWSSAQSLTTVAAKTIEIPTVHFLYLGTVEKYIL